MLETIAFYHISKLNNIQVVKSCFMNYASSEKNEGQMKVNRHFKNCFFVVVVYLSLFVH